MGGEMNTEQRFNKIEQRVEKLEQDRNGIVESEKLLLKMARYHRIGLQELGARIELDMGDIRERFDTIERTMVTKDDLAELRGNLAELRGNLAELRGNLAELKARQGEHSNRFDRLDATLAEILTRLPKPGGE
jgi:chromosome segregation ATPase